MARKKIDKTVPKRSKSSANLSTGQDEALPDEGVAREAIRLSFLIHDVSRLRRTAFDQLMKPLGVTRTQWWVLAHLSRQDGMMQTQLADALDVGKASLGTFLERLEETGLIERREDLIDKRAKRVFMARAGQQLLKQMTLKESRFNERILRNLSPEARESMIQNLTQIKRALLEQIGPGSDDDAD